MTQSGTALTAFEGLRGRLFGLAHRMLGSRADAEDIVQEAYVRWHEVTKDRNDNLEAWLVTTTCGWQSTGCDGSRPNVRRTSANGYRNRS